MFEEYAHAMQVKLCKPNTYGVTVYSDAELDDIKKEVAPLA